MPKGRVKNHSTKTLWVVETETGTAVAHKLASRHQSPQAVDADGFRATDGTAIDGHASWIKLVDLSTADVADRGVELTRGCILCKNVGDNEFGNISYENSDNGGEPL